jgi:plasmid maintenance system antidote protein VapI
MCEVLGYQHTYLSKIENGKSPLTLEFVTRVASQFGDCDSEVWKLAEHLAEVEKNALQEAVKRAIAERAGLDPPSSERVPS